MKPKVITYIWFDSGAEEAVKFYKNVFGDNLVVGNAAPYLVDTPSNKPIGSVMTVEFELFGQKFALLNGGPFFKPSEAISFMIECRDQKEVDAYWDALSSDPNAEACGWLKDKYGISWQIVPKGLDEMLASGDRLAAARVMKAILGMKKIVLADLEKAFRGYDADSLRKAG